MFGLFARKTKEPTKVEMVCEIEIDATCEEVFAALDLRSDTNRYLARGWTFEPVEGQANTFCGVDPNMPDLEIFFTETERQPKVCVETTSRFGEGVVVGALMEGRGRYLLTPLPDGRCGVELNETATLCAGLTEKRIQEERFMLMIAVNDDLSRLKALVEDGPDAAAEAGALDKALAKLEAQCAA